MSRGIAVLLLAGMAVTGCAPSGGKVGSNPLDLGQDQGQMENPPADPSPPKEVMPVEPFPETAEKFSKPWTNPQTMIVIDAYQGNSIDWNKMAGDRRVAGVIHRSTIGFTVDSMYRSRMATALARGYLWGAYHLGKSGDPIGQAKLFLRTVGDPSKVLMILDLEDTSNGNLMNIAEGKKFLQYVFDQTGRMPVVYANDSVTKALTRDGASVFKRSRLWYARFRSNIPDFPGGLWPTYFLWQFSSEINCSTTGDCLYNVPGTKSDMDVNVFYGSRAALEYQWGL